MTVGSEAAPRPRVFRVSYAWIVLAALCVTETISWGIVYYGFPVFLSAVERDLHASSVAVTGAFSIALAIAAAAGVPVGRWLDRCGPRALMTAGSCLAAGLLLAWSRIHSVGALYAVWCGLGLAMAAVLYEPAFVSVVQWFPRHRDRAMLILTLAAGLASTIFMPLAAWLLGRFGWRMAIEILAGLLAATTIPIHALVLRPAQHPGVSTPASGAAAGAGASLRQALRIPVFWVLAGAFAASNFAAITVTVHAIPYLGRHGYPVAYAAAAVGWIGAMQLPGRVLFVPITSWFGLRTVTASIFLVQGAAMALLAVVAHLPTLAPVIFLLGAANGMSTLARATVVADVFGRRHYGSVGGAIAMSANGARALGPVGASLLIAGLGGYEPVFWALAGGLAIAGAAVLLARFEVGAREREFVGVPDARRV
jgi:MFS family permease